MIELLRECRDALGNIHTYAHKTDFVLKESSDMLKRLDAALAGKDAVERRTGLASKSLWDRTERRKVAVLSLPEEPDSTPCYEETDKVHKEWIAYAEILRTFALRAVKERDEAWAAVEEADKAFPCSEPAHGPCPYCNWRSKHAAVIAAARRGR